MISPVVGAALAIAIRRSLTAELRWILGPYFAWTALGIATGVLVLLVGPSHLTPESPPIQELVSAATSWALIGATVTVPMLVPFLRAVGWAMSPPNA